MRHFNSLQEIIAQLELPDYKTEDGLHRLADNVAFVQLKKMSALPVTEVIDNLKNMANNYIVCLQSYVIPKSVLDLYIEHLENRNT